MDKFKKERIEILDEIAVHVKLCDCREQRNPTCPNCKKLHKLGERLEQLTAKRRNSLKIKSHPSMTARREVNITVEEYITLTGAGLTDVAIRNSKNITKGVFARWKQENGLQQKK